MARFLVVGNLSYEQTPDIKSPWDIRVFFSHPEAEFLNTGPGRDIFGKQQRPKKSILADVRDNAYELIVFGNTAFPSFNPRKGWIRNSANFLKKNRAASQCAHRCFLPSGKAAHSFCRD